MIKKAAVVVLLLLSCLPAAALPDRGGSVAAYWADAQTDTKPVLDDCASACTMRLAHARCIARDASFLFHAATQPLGTLILARMLGPARDWYLARCTDGHECVVSGLWLHERFGYQLCGG